jgi:hypothetical protein
LVRVPVDGLLAEQHQIGFFGVDQGLERQGDETAVQGVVVRVHSDRAAGAGGQRGPERLLHLLRAERNDHDLTLPLLRGGAVLGQAQGRFERVLVEWIHLPLETARVHGSAAGLHFDLVRVVGIGDALQGNQDFHGA